MAEARFFIMRHGETVYNAGGRLQANHIHTPLTRRGVEQALRMGEVLKGALGESPAATLHVSAAGRALQTAALIAEVMGLDWFAARRTTALHEIDMGSWCERTYADVEAEHGRIVDADHLLTPAPDGESYPAIAARLQGWLEHVGDAPGNHIVVMHGLSSRVLRGMMTGLPAHAAYGVPIAPSLPQGSIAVVTGRREDIIFRPQSGNERA